MVNALKIPIIGLCALLHCQAKEVGIASYYSIRSNNGTRTASGIRLNDSHYVAAHKNLKFGTTVKVTNLNNKKSIFVKIIDRGPFVKGRVIDVSLAAANALHFRKQGIAKVSIEVVNKGKAKTAPRAIVVQKTKIQKTKDYVLAQVKKVVEFLWKLKNQIL